MKYVIGNWKMYPKDLQSAKALALLVAKTVKETKRKV